MSTDTTASTLTLWLRDPGGLARGDVINGVLRSHESLVRDRVADEAGAQGIWSFKRSTVREGSIVATATFASAEDALRCAIAIQQDTRRAVSGRKSTDSTRLQPAIVLTMGATGQSIAVMGGQIICSGAFHDETAGLAIRSMVGWAPARNDESRRDDVECLYDDALTLLNAPLERMFAEELREWVAPRRQRRYEENMGPLLDAQAQAEMRSASARASVQAAIDAVDTASEEKAKAQLTAAAAEVQVAVDNTNAVAALQRPPVFPWPERPDPRNELVGLALSGGGMRSAVFSLGVLQALARHNFLEDVDYVSSVSGGAYVGTSISTLCAEQLPYEEAQRFGTTRDSFPFATPRPTGDNHDGSERSVHGNESPATQHVRYNANLLARSPGLFDAYSWSKAGRYLVSTGLLWVFFLLPATTLLTSSAILMRLGFLSMGNQWRIGCTIGLPAVCAIVTLMLGIWVIAGKPNAERARTMMQWAAAIGAGVAVALTLLWVAAEDVPLEARVGLALTPVLAFVVASFISLVGAAPRWPASRRERLESFAESATSLLATTAFILATTLSLTGLVALFEVVFNNEHELARWSTLATGIVSASVAGYSIKEIWSEFDAWNSKPFRKLVWNAALAIGGYVLMGLLVGLWAWRLWAWRDDMPLWAFGLIPGAAFAATALPFLLRPQARAALNWLSLNGMYSEVIGKTWMIGAAPPRPQKGPAFSHWAKVWPRSDLTVGDLRELHSKDMPEKGDPDRRPTAPYHMICTALNLPGSKGDKMLDRKAESFILAPIYSGSALTRWMETSKHPSIKAMPLAAATAISGAAVSPNMGSHTTRTLSIITTLLNVRMGQWVTNPRKPKPAGWRAASAQWLRDAPTVLYWKELLGMASKRDGDVYLSDGGHFENLGLYELLRRRCKYIIAVTADTGSRDTSFDLGNIATALRLARVDFGVEVEFKSLKPLLRDLKSGYAAGCYTAAKIIYPSSEAHPSERDERTGILIVIKTGLVEDKVPPDVLNYWLRNNPGFPYDPTTDQQFDQPQFEAYRQLGFIAGHEATDPAIERGAKTTKQRFDAILAACQPESDDPPRRRPRPVRTQGSQT